MNSSGCIRAPGLRPRGPPLRGRGAPRGVGFSVRGTLGGLRGGRRGIGGPYRLPGEGCTRGGLLGSRRGQARGLLSSKPAVCFICEVGEARYKFRCCSRPFCSTTCYKKHTENPCAGPPKQDQPQQAASGLTDVAAVEPIHAELNEDAGDLEVDPAVLRPASGATGRLQDHQQNTANPETLSSPLSSSDSETESGEASSDESDVSRGDPNTQWSSSHHQPRSGGRFDTLTPTEQERIKQLALRPEMQSTALREAIRSLVLAASQSIGRGSATLTSLMRRPDFATFIDMLMEALDTQNAETEEMPPPKLEPCLTRRYLGEAGLRPN